MRLCLHTASYTQTTCVFPMSARTSKDVLAHFCETIASLTACGAAGPTKIVRASCCLHNAPVVSGPPDGEHAESIKHNTCPCELVQCPDVAGAM